MAGVSPTVEVTDYVNLAVSVGASRTRVQHNGDNRSCNERDEDGPACRNERVCA